MPSPNDPAVDAFVAFFTPGTAHYKNVGWLVTNVFCVDAGTPDYETGRWLSELCRWDGSDLFPGVGPFTTLFQQLIISFPHLHVAVLPPRCYSDDLNTITLQMVLVTGGHAAAWFRRIPRIVQSLFQILCQLAKAHHDRRVLFSLLIHPPQATTGLLGWGSTWIVGRWRWTCVG